jgi:hydrogenase-4 component F
MIHALFLLPLLGAVVAWMTESNSRRPLVLPVVALPHFLLVLAVAFSPYKSVHGGWIMLDALGALVLLAVSLLFLGCSVYAVGYLGYYRQERSNRVFCVALMISLASMSLACMAQHLGLMWVAMETTTVIMAPLIYFNRNARSIEATWKYLLIGSVGIALALLGIYFLAYATLVAGSSAGLLLAPLLATAKGLDPRWLKGAVIFLLVGFGTKLGLAPLHTWKPDAYGEAPGLVGALLAGGLTSVAFLALLRVYQIVGAAGGLDGFMQTALIVLGLISMAFAALFLVHQTDVKRMLAYSSVEHVGIMALALGIGKGALLGALMHLVGNCLTKGGSFLSVGNLHRSYGSKSTYIIQGALRRLPWSGSIFMAAFLAVSAFPPFLQFISELTIATAAFGMGQYWVAGLYLLFLALIFLGLTPAILRMLMGSAPEIAAKGSYRDRILTVAPPLLLLVVVLVLGVWLPPPLMRMLKDGALLLGAQP